MDVHTTINKKIISIPKTDEVTYLQNHINALMSELYFLHEELKEKNNLKILLNKTEVIKHVAICNNKTLKADQPSPTNKNQKLVVNDTSNASNPMNESYYNNSTENITSSNHCAGLLIGGDEYVSVENNLHDSTNDSYKRDMNNNRTDNKNNNNINNITKVNKNNDHHLGEKDQIKTKKLVVKGRHYG